MPLTANTIGGQYGMNTLQEAGMDAPLAMDLLSTMPSAATTTMWNMSRVSRTMSFGGRRRAQYARGLRQTFSPLAFGRLANAKNIEPVNRSGYSPFNILSRAGNRVARTANNRFAADSAFIRRLNAFGTPTDGNYFSSGSFGRFATMGRAYTGSGDTIRRMLPNVSSALGDLNPNLASSLSQGVFYAENRLRVSELTALSMRGTLSQGMAGYMNASRFGVNNLEMARMLPGSSYALGAERQAAHLAAGGFRGTVAKNARFLPVAARAAGIAGNILIARDLAVMAGKVVSTLGQTAIEGARSVKGSIDKPIFGMGYRDNTVAATSRARGVQAIANSRLNMRSVLGSEAAAMHAYYG